LKRIVDDAFPGSGIMVDAQGGRFEVSLKQHGLLRPLSAAELSDGTLRFLLWTAALLTPRPPELMVLNEPETSLHPDLLPALARLISAASERSQILVISHAQSLIQELERIRDCKRLHLEKSFGETALAESTPFNTPRWEWPPR
jgi:predicted ATPase